MAEYRKKPVEVEAYQWTADIKQEEYPDWSNEAYKRGDIKILCAGSPACRMVIKTLESEVVAKPGDYIIRGVSRVKSIPANRIYSKRPTSL